MLLIRVLLIKEKVCYFRYTNVNEVGTQYDRHKQNKQFIKRSDRSETSVLSNHSKTFEGMTHLMQEMDEFGDKDVQRGNSSSSQHFNQFVCIAQRVVYSS